MAIVKTVGNVRELKVVDYSYDISYTEIRPP